MLRWFRLAAQCNAVHPLMSCWEFTFTLLEYQETINIQYKFSYLLRYQLLYSLYVSKACSLPQLLLQLRVGHGETSHRSAKVIER